MRVAYISKLSFPTYHTYHYYPNTNHHYGYKISLLMVLAPFWLMYVGRNIVKCCVPTVTFSSDVGGTY